MHDDRHWLEGLWHRHAGHVWSYAARRVGRVHADDVVADTFVVAWRHRRRRPTRELPWLYGVARRVIATHDRGDRRRRRLVMRLEDTTSHEGAMDDLRLMALSSMARLTPAEREVLMLLAWEGLSPDEAAQALGIGNAAFRRRVSRARRRLRETLEEA